MYKPQSSHNWVLINSGRLVGHKNPGFKIQSSQSWKSLSKNIVMAVSFKLALNNGPKLAVGQPNKSLKKCTLLGILNTHHGITAVKDDGMV